MKLTIAFDFDGTFAADPETFRTVVKAFQEAGHTCVLITNRDETWGEEVRELVGDLMPIILAGTTSKRSAAICRGYAVDIWIDDTPEYVDLNGLVFRPTTAQEGRDCGHDQYQFKQKKGQRFPILVCESCDHVKGTYVDE